MPRFARQLLAASLVALHAAVMLCGPCLHAVPGWGHAPGLSRSSDVHHVRTPSAASLLQADDCPVCHFLSQAQLPVDPARVVAVAHVRVLDAPRDREPVPPAPFRSTSPRAPPGPRAGLS